MFGFFIKGHAPGVELFEGKEEDVHGGEGKPKVRAGDVEDGACDEEVPEHHGAFFGKEEGCVVQS